MKKILLTMLVVINFNLNAASYMQCSGLDNLGYKINLTANINADIINVNGNLLKVIGKTKDGKGVYTENFINPAGTLAYISLAPKGSNNLLIYQFNAITQKLIANGLLTCSFSLINQVSEHPIFKK